MFFGRPAAQPIRDKSRSAALRCCQEQPKGSSPNQRLERKNCFPKTEGDLASLGDAAKDAILLVADRVQDDGAAQK